MKALSIRQPWAWLIVNGHKDIENRCWKTHFRGKIYVHASKGMTRGDYLACEICCSDIPGAELPPFETLERGGIVGTVEIVDCVDQDASPWFFGEFEVKVSVSDFKADGKKERSGYAYEEGKYRKIPATTKHDRLAARDPKGPCRFWFAMPEKIAEQVEIPEWAGMISFGERSMTGRVIKVAPQLHRQKVSDRVIDHAKGVFYYRYWNIRRYAVEDETEVTL